MRVALLAVALILAALLAGCAGGDYEVDSSSGHLYCLGVLTGWLRKIKREFDPNNTSDPTVYASPKGRH